MHILISPNAFKNSCSAAEAAAAIRKGLEQSRLQCTTECLPVADGGDGTAALLVQQCGGSWQSSIVQDPLGRKINTVFGLIDEGRTAIIEMANASGLRLLNAGELNPLRTLSYGTGQQVQQALDLGVQKIIIAMGGSATVDGACGMLAALGVRFLNAAGQKLQDLPGSLVDLASIDITGLDKRLFGTSLVVLCDVGNTLLGAKGAAAVFGPQKGAGPEAVQQLDACLHKLATLALTVTGRDMAAVPSGGTAGGAAAGLFAFCNASLENGIDYFLSLTHYTEALRKANLVITGEGSIDEQTLQGKGPFGVAALAKRSGIPVIAMAGSVPLQPGSGLQEYFDVLLPIGNQPVNLPAAMAATERNLVRTATELGNLLALKNI